MNDSLTVGAPGERPPERLAGRKRPVVTARVGGILDELRPPLSHLRALLEADRCLQCGGPEAEAPCTLACPAEIDVPAFLAAITRSDPGGAAATIFAANALGGSCARVCPVEILCEGACVLEREARRPVEIGRLQRYATDWALAHGLQVRRAAAWNGKRVAVIGAGPAGLACAAELATLGYRVTVYEAREDSGGLIRYAIAPYRQVREPLPQEVERIAALGVELRLGRPVGRPEVLREIEESADAVFLGVGLGDDVDARYPGHDLPGVWQSLRFIEAIKTGRAPWVGDRVAVIGGGNTAIDVAREAVRLGAREVFLVYRRTEAEMPAYRHEREEARAEAIQFVWLTQPIRFVGTNRLEAIECQRMRLGEPDRSGRARPEPIPGSEFLLPAHTAILAIGQKTRTEFLGWIEGLELDGGLVRIDPETGQTANPKYFAGGDVVNGGATVVEAVRAGKIAARGIHRCLSRPRPENEDSVLRTGEPSPEGRSDGVAAPAVGFEPSHPERYGPVWRYRQGDAALVVNRAWCKGCDLCVDACPPAILALDAAQLVYVTDITKCIFCGLCAARCPDYVFVLERPSEQRAVVVPEVTGIGAPLNGDWD